MQAGLGKHRLGVELHAFDRQLAMAQAHDEAVGLGGDFQFLGQAFPLDDQRVVARGNEILLQLAKMVFES